MNFDNKNNSVLITGGTQGLGFEIANQLIENGCSEIIIAVSYTHLTLPTICSV